MELKEITPYLAHGLNVWINEDIDCSSNGDNPQYDEIAGFIKKGKYKLVAIGTDGNSMFCSDVALLDENHTEAMTELKYIKLILHPLSDLVKPCLGGDKIPIVELAKIDDPKRDWIYEDGFCQSCGTRDFHFETGYFYTNWANHKYTSINHLALFNWLYEHHFWLGDQSRFGKDIIDINALIVK